MVEVFEMILADLKERTKTLHAQTELAFALDQRLATRDSYVALLSRMLGFYAPLEPRMPDAVGARELGFDLQEREKTSLLRADLSALGLSPAEIAAIPNCSRLPQIPRVANLFGCLYVLEGSTLGGQIIRREVHRRLGFTADNGCAFFAGYHDKTAEAWREFGEALTRYSVGHPQEQEQIVGTAAETFQRFEEWVAC
jgi:heme oxygenase